MRALLLLMLLPLMQAKAEQRDIQCPGNNTFEMRWDEMRWCTSKRLGESKAALEKKLSPETLKQWREATVEVYSAAYSP